MSFRAARPVVVPSTRSTWPAVVPSGSAWSTVVVVPSHGVRHGCPIRVRHGCPILGRPLGSCRGNLHCPSCRPTRDPRTHPDTIAGTVRAGLARQLPRPGRPAPSRRWRLLSQPYVRFSSSAESTHNPRYETLGRASVLDPLLGRVRNVPDGTRHTHVTTVRPRRPMSRLNSRSCLLRRSRLHQTNPRLRTSRLRTRCPLP